MTETQIPVEKVWEGMPVGPPGERPATNGHPTDRTPPHDAAAERAVLGAAILKPDLVPELAGILGDDDFYDPANSAVWDAILDRHIEGQPIDPVLLARDVGQHRSLAGHGGPLYLHTLIQDVPAVASATHYARAVADRANERKTVELGTWLVQAGHGGTDPAGVRERLETHLAKQGAPGGGTRYDQLLAALLDADGLKSIRPPEPLIGGYIVRDSLTWLQGKPGHGKSFVAIDWACSVATGQPWRGAPVHQGTVLYIIAEGAAGISLRVDAWRDAHGTYNLDRLKFLPVPVQFLVQVDHDALKRLVAEIQPVMVVIDTQARVTVGAEENSSRDMGMFVAAADAIREASGACVLVVHHEGRGGEHLRGSTAMEGAATTIVRASKDGPLVYLECKKQKDDDEFLEITMRLVRLGESAVLSHETIGMASIVTETEHQLIATLRDSFGPEGVATSVLREAAGLPKTTYYRALRTLEGRGVVRNISTTSRPLYVLTSTAGPDGQQSLNVTEEDPDDD